MTQLTPELVDEMLNEAVDSKTILNEHFRVSAVGKLFLAALAGAVLGKHMGYQVRGTPSEVAAVKSALMSSKSFRHELEKPGASVESVINKLNLKRASAREFEKVLGVPWPLMISACILTEHAAAYFI